MTGFIILLAVFSLAGCAVKAKYNWGGYDSMLYAGYKDPNKMEAMKVGLENHIAEMDKTGQKIAPGLLAELGTLYLQAGSVDKAVLMYGRERDTWPESKWLMAAMIKNIERRNLKLSEAAK